MFVYQFAFLDYYEPVEHWEVDVFEVTKENYPRSSEYAKAQVIMLGEVTHSYSHQGNL